MRGVHSECHRGLIGEACTQRLPSRTVIGRGCVKRPRYPIRAVIGGGDTRNPASVSTRELRMVVCLQRGRYPTQDEPIDPKIRVTITPSRSTLGCVFCFFLCGAELHPPLLLMMPSPTGCCCSDGRGVYTATATFRAVIGGGRVQRPLPCDCDWRGTPES